MIKKKQVARRTPNARPKARLNTFDYWKQRLGLGDRCFDGRKNMVLNRVRQKWPQRHQLSKSSDGHTSQLKSWLKDLVAGFNDAHRYETDLGDGDAFEKQLRLYTEWAFVLNSQARDYGSGGRRKENQGPTVDALAEMDRSNTMVPLPRNDTGRTNHADETIIKEEEQAPGSTRDTPLRLSHTPPPIVPPRPPHDDLATTTSFNWDTVEVSIEAGALTLGTIWLPMINIKPKGNSAMRCAWHQFELEDLKEHFASDTGVLVDTEQYEFVYIGGQSRFAFTRTGGYRIALKRFVETGAAADNVLSLEIQARNVTARADSAIPKPIRARSQFVCASSDYSDDSKAEEPPQERHDGNQAESQRSRWDKSAASYSDDIAAPTIEPATVAPGNVGKQKTGARIEDAQQHIDQAKEYLTYLWAQRTVKARKGLSTAWYDSRISGLERKLP
ncbi:hypothetical protein PMZ80_008904 [Knufia obscura]|uniref:Uncharacterized protein n=1 Tax=Knufia obscura TaxID=1635080 RepID=A0ABR0RDL4_9EURO|nr:hypothetical protein PMZ80_008904 [Knufia obscura]